MGGLPTSFPERVGRYDLLLPIAAGGMATVFLATSRGIGGFEREVALKLTHAHLREKGTFASDMIEEAKLAARIRHPNVVPVLDVGDDAAGIFLVMEYVEGDALGSLVRGAAERGSRVPIGVALRILVDALAGLHAAHELKDQNGAPLNLVHRDFSPQNILVDVEGRAQLADFGVAKAATRPGQTIAGFVKGKIAYMSPEQGRGLSIDRTTDVWAAGVIAWELVAGRRLYPPGNDTDRLLKVVSDRPPLVREFAPDAPLALEEAIARALTMDARHRTQSAAAFGKELTQAAAAAGGLAGLDEVSAYVREISGPKLDERRAVIAGLRARRVEIEGGDIGQFVRPEDLPTSDELPRGLRDPKSDSATLPFDAPNPSLSKDAASRSRAESDPDNVPTQPDKFGGATDVMISVPSATPPALAAAQAATSGIDTVTRRAGRWRLGPAPIAAGAVLALIAAIVVWRASEEEPAGGATAAPTVVVEAAPPQQATHATAPATGAPTATNANDGADVSPSLTLRANRPIAALWIGGRAVAIDEPTAELTVPIRSGDARDGARVEALSSDGKRAAASLSAGASRLELKFTGAGAKTTAGGTTPTRPNATEARRPSLAPSPYGKTP